MDTSMYIIVLTKGIQKHLFLFYSYMKHSEVPGTLVEFIRANIHKWEHVS